MEFVGCYEVQQKEKIQVRSLLARLVLEVGVNEFLIEGLDESLGLLQALLRENFAVLQENFSLGNSEA